MKPIHLLVCLCAAALWCPEGIAALIVTSLDDSGPGSLRSAIAGATAGETINFSVTGTLTLSSGQLLIDKPLRITGPGSSQLLVQRSSDPGTPEFRIFRITSAGVSISGLSVGNGRLVGTFDDGAGILNSGELSLSACLLTGNTTAGDYSRGAAIYNDFGARLTIDQCRFERNRGTGLYAAGGAVYIFGAASISRSSFIENSAADLGGGVHIDYFGVAALAACTFAGNAATGESGAGGGLYNFGEVALTNCTFSGNSAVSSGGGIHNDALSRLLTIRSCTITANAAPDGSAIHNAGDAFFQSGTVDVRNTIIVANVNAPDFQNDGTVQSGGHNLFGLVAGNPVTPKPGDQFGVAATAVNLGPLAGNGGPTLTHALLAGSIALDAGDDSDCPPADQRGAPRPGGSHCDIGAFELGNAAPGIQCPEAMTLECSSADGALAGVTVNVRDADGNALTVVWSVDDVAYQTNFLQSGTTTDPTGVSLLARFGMGAHDLSVSVWDGITAPVTCSTTVTVRDSLPPIIHGITATPNLLSPPNHKLVPVRLRVTASDACGPVSSRIKSVTTDDPDAGKGHGNKSPDWVITGDLTLELRAERSDRAGRVYSITVECSDRAGNSSTGVVNVTVSGN